MLGLALGEVEMVLGARAGGGFLGPRRAALHPFSEVGDLLVAQLTARRHFQIHIVVTDRFDEQAISRLAANNSWAGIAAFHYARPMVEQQAALQFLGISAMAFETMFGQHRPDFFLKEF